MKTNIINVGNSRGIILPSSILKELKLTLKSAVHIFTENGAIVIKAAPREGWEEAARQMRASDEGEMLLPDVFDNENLDEWTWTEKMK